MVVPCSIIRFIATVVCYIPYGTSDGATVDFVCEEIARCSCLQYYLPEVTRRVYCSNTTAYIQDHLSGTRFW